MRVIIFKILERIMFWVWDLGNWLTNTAAEKLFVLMKKVYPEGVE